MKHLVLVGACYLDTILSVPHFPDEDAKLRATKLEIRRGGNCPNSLEVLQQFITEKDNVQLHLACCLPHEDAPSTTRIISSFGRDTSINFGHCIYRRRHAEAASSYIIRSKESGSRTIVNYNELPEMTLDEFAAIVGGFTADDASWWHFEGRIPETTIECIRLLRHKLPNANISVEVEKPGREGLLPLALEGDVVFYSRTWAESRGYTSAESCLTNERRRQGSLGLCTWGADGAVLSQGTGPCLHFPVKTETDQITVMDPVGAGDTFIAGMLLGLVRNNWPLSGSNISKAASFAVKLATLKVQREGFQGLAVDIAEG